MAHRSRQNLPHDASDRSYSNHDLPHLPNRGLTSSPVVVLRGDAGLTREGNTHAI